MFIVYKYTKTTIESSNGILRFAFKDAIKDLEANKKKESLIFLHFSYNGNRFKYSTGYKSCFIDWDFDKQRIKQTKPTIINPTEVNEFLSKIENSIKKEYSRLIAEQTIVTNEVLKLFLDNYLNKNVVVSNIKPKTFFEFCEAFLELKPKITLITKRSYKQSLIKLKNYAIDNNIKINFNSFDKTFVINFIDYLEENDFAQNTISKHLKNLKTFLIEANDKRLFNNVDFNIKDFKASPEETTAIYLTDNELEKMLAVDLSDKKHYELARDVFLIGCYTSQRISDYNGIDKNCIKKIENDYYFSFRQKKTKKAVNCYISPEIKEIMDLRHNGLPPKKILEKDLNKNIKRVGKLLEFTENVECISKKGGQEIVEYIEKYQLIHSHTARRSFCTNNYKKGNSVTDIMHFSGHTTEREFYKYIRIIGEERASHIVDSGLYFNL